MSGAFDEDEEDKEEGEDTVDDEEDNEAVGVVYEISNSVDAMCNPDEYGTGPNLDRTDEIRRFASSSFRIILECI